MASSEKQEGILGSEAGSEWSEGQTERGLTRPALGEIGLSRFSPYLMNRIMGRWNVDVQEKLRPHDLTAAKMRTLGVLTVIPGLSINELSVYAVTEQSTMSRTLDAMEAQGMIRRVGRESDGRVREIYITDTGRAAFDGFWPEMYDKYERLFTGISDSEREDFTNTLQKLLKNIRHYDF